MRRPDLVQTRSHNLANEIDTDDDHANAPGASIAASTGDNWIDPVYDAAGNMIFGPQPGYEATAAMAQHYVYDAWNRMTAVWRDNGDTAGTLETSGAGQDARLTECEYDGLHRRIERVKYNSGTPLPSEHFYYNTSWQVLEVRLTGFANPPKQYVWDQRYIDAAVVRFFNSDFNLDNTYDDAADNILYYMADGNFNVTGLVDVADGEVVERYMYEPYGKVTVLHGVRNAQGIGRMAAHSWTAIE